MNCKSLACFVLVIAASITQSACAAITGLERVASGLAAPIFVTHAPGDLSRLFIAERGGTVKILNLETGNIGRGTFMSTTVDISGEGGLLGLAFHPNYFNEGAPGFGKLYVNVTTTSSPLTTRIREFTVDPTDPNLVDTLSIREIISFEQPQSNHNGGWIGFSPRDHFLYIATGDGGGGDDNDTGHTPGTGNAQDFTDNLLGKMLRIDPTADDFEGDAGRNYAIPPSNPFAGLDDMEMPIVGDDEIWSYGLRNPFRASFDRVTGDLWIGDVGQGTREEIDLQPAASEGGENYGWRLREGSVATPSGGVGGPEPLGHVGPVYDYGHVGGDFGGIVVTGGYVYRGPDPDLRGKYFFLDSRHTAVTSDDNYWMFDPANPYGTVDNINAELTPDVGTKQFPVSFGEDADGNLYIAYLVSGEVFRIATDVVLPGDIDADGSVDFEDYALWQERYGTNDPPADLNGDKTVNAADYTIWRNNLGRMLPEIGSGSGNAPEPASVVLMVQLAFVIAFARSCRTKAGKL